MKNQSNLATKQVLERLKHLNQFSKYTRIQSGWIRYLRKAMFLTQSTLAKKAGLSQTTVLQIEKREKTGNVTIQSMKKLAAVMDCEFVYAIVPKKELSKYLKEKAIVKATRAIQEADIHMTLENQQVTSKITKRIERLAEELLLKGDIW